MLHLNSKRSIKVPDYWGDWQIGKLPKLGRASRACKSKPQWQNAEGDKNINEGKKRKVEKDGRASFAMDRSGMYAVQDILEERCSNVGKEYLVKWNSKDLLKGESQVQWVHANENPGLVAYLDRNRTNPYSCTLNREAIHKESDSLHSILPRDVLALRQLIFDQLGERRYTSDGSQGVRRRVSVSLPFSREAFLSTFYQQCGQVSILAQATENTSFYIDGQQLLQCIGSGFATRSFANSTVCYVNCGEKIHVAWQYKPRVNYIHTECARCTHVGCEEERPAKCSNYREFHIHGPPFLKLTFTVGRRNRVSNSIATKSSKCSHK